MKQIFTFLGAALGATVGFLYGEVDGMFYAVVAFMVIDYLTGIANAIKNKELNSRTGFWGIFRKIGILSALAVAHIIDSQVLKEGAVLMTATELFFVANEGISILENLGGIGVKLPKKLLAVLEKLQKESEGEEDETDDQSGRTDSEEGTGEDDDD